MAKIRGKIVVAKERCKGCGVCLGACPQKILELNPSVNSKGYNYTYMVRSEDCTGCANCALVCPDFCITVYRQKFEE